MIRKNFTALSVPEREALANALNLVQSDGLVGNNAELHRANFNKGIHWGPAFLPWHRDFLKKFESALQRYEPSVTLPYWDWPKSDSRNIDISPWKEFFGGRDNRGGNFDHWPYKRNDAPFGSLPKIESVIQLLDKQTFTEFRGFESGAHGAGHNWIGHDMGDLHSPIDPIFYLHHCNVDRLWSIWQLNHPTAVQYDPDGKVLGNDRVPAARVKINDPMIGGATPASTLDLVAQGYTYQQDNELEAAWLTEKGTPLITHLMPVTA